MQEVKIGKQKLRMKTMEVMVFRSEVTSCTQAIDQGQIDLAIGKVSILSSVIENNLDNHISLLLCLHLHLFHKKLNREYLI